MKTVIEHSKRAHASFAPSSAVRWMNCLGSVELAKKAPPQKESPYALEGTIAHEVLEFIVHRYANIEKARVEALKKYKAHKMIVKYGFDAEVMVDHAVKSAHTVYSLRPSKSAKLLIETRVTLSKEVYGTLDYAWVEDFGMLVVTDYKYGAGVPVLPIDDDGIEDAQLMTYAAALAKKYNYEFDSIKLAVIQPRVWRDDEDPLTVGMTTVKRLRDFEKRALLAVVEGKKPGGKLVYSEKGCRWCPASSFCPEISKGQMDSVGIAFDVEDGITKLPVVEALKPEAFKVLLPACDALETWIESVRAQAFRLASDGEEIPKYKLVEKRSIRQWLPIAMLRAKKLFGERAFKTEFLSPAQLEKAVGKKEGKAFTEKFSTGVSSGFTLVKDSDKRTAVTSAVAFDVEAE